MIPPAVWSQVLAGPEAILVELDFLDSGPQVVQDLEYENRDHCSDQCAIKIKFKVSGMTSLRQDSSHIFPVLVFTFRKVDHSIVFQCPRPLCCPVFREVSVDKRNPIRSQGRALYEKKTARKKEYAKNSMDFA